MAKWESQRNLFQKHSEAGHGITVHACYSNIWEAEAGGFWVSGYTLLHNKTLSQRNKNKTYTEKSD